MHAVDCCRNEIVESSLLGFDAPLLHPIRFLEGHLVTHHSAHVAPSFLNHTFATKSGRLNFSKNHWTTLQSDFISKDYITIFQNGIFEPSHPILSHHGSRPLGHVHLGSVRSYHRKPDFWTVLQQSQKIFRIQRLDDSSEPTCSCSSWRRWTCERRLQGGRGMRSKSDWQFLYLLFIGFDLLHYLQWPISVETVVNSRHFVDTLVIAARQKFGTRCFSPNSIGFDRRNTFGVD